MIKIIMGSYIKMVLVKKQKNGKNYNEILRDYYNNTRQYGIENIGKIKGFILLFIFKPLILNSGSGVDRITNLILEKYLETACPN